MENEFLYQINDDFKKSLVNFLNTKPFAEVYMIMNLLGKNELKEDDANLILNTLAKYPYAEVVELINNFLNNIVKKDTDVTEKIEFDK